MPLFFAWFAYIPLTVVVIKGAYYGFHINRVLGLITFMVITYLFRKSQQNQERRKLKHF